MPPKRTAIAHPDDHNPEEDVNLIPLDRISRDIRNAAALLSKQEIRYLVDLYYEVQGMRTASGNQIRGLREAGEPNEIVKWTNNAMHQVENTIKGALGVAAKADPVGEWSLSVVGIGPVLAAGFLSHIDIERAPTVSHIWRFAGLDPTSVWEPKTRRPWNARLKVLCWKAGESFVKWQNHENGVYGRLFYARKIQEWQRNLNGDNAAQAKKLAGVFKQTTDSHPWYAGNYVLPVDFPGDLVGAMLAVKSPSRHADLLAEAETEGSGVPMLPPGHVHARAKRRAVKQFLVDWHRQAYLNRYGKEPPMPYALEHLPSHSDFRIYGSDRYVSVDQAREMLGLPSR